MSGNFAVASSCFRNDRKACDGDLKDIEPTELGLWMLSLMWKSWPEGASLNVVSLTMGGLGEARRGGRRTARRMMTRRRAAMGRKKRRQQERRCWEDSTEGLR